MDDEWGKSVADGNDEGRSNGLLGVDSGRTFSRGRGFSAARPGNEDDGGWGSTNDDTGWGSSSRDNNRGRGGRENKDDRSCDKNGNGDWGNFEDADDGERKGRDGNRGGFRSNNDGGWGQDDEGSSRGRGGGRGRGGRGGFRNNDDDDEYGGGRRGRGGRGSSRGGFRSRDENGGNEWGGDGDNTENSGGGGWGESEGGDSWGDSGGRGGGRGRGGRGGGRGGFRGAEDDGENKPEKPREIYIPPDPTNDESEMFGTNITSGINFAKYDNIPIDVSGNGHFDAAQSFEESGLRPIMLKNINKSGYTKPTPIQKTAIPIIMAGRDVMACAQTGSGKTAAFLLPIINNLIADNVDLICENNSCEPQAVIVSPTRELAIQIWNEARKFAHDSIVKTVVAYGGVSVNYQIKQILAGCHILVATPGRMNDFVNKDLIKFSSVRFIVLDEADRMLDMGFLKAIEDMLDHPTMVPTGKRQTLMFSATFPEEIQRLASKFLHNYLFITVGIVGGACSDVQQIFHKVDKFKKRQKLLSLLTEEGSLRTLVFVETKRNADFIATYLSENQLRTTSIHGDRLQREREEALRDFKTGKRDILVATDVAARGLDIKNVEHVINYDLPKSIDEYVHRIGRTGRVGNRGKATSFFDDSQDGPLAANLIRILRQANQNIPDWLESASQGGGDSYNSRSFGGRDVRDEEFQQPALTAVEPEEEW